MDKLDCKAKFVTTVDGKDFKLPKISWGQEKQIISIVADIVSTIPDLEIEKHDMSNFQIGDAIEMLPVLLRNSQEHVGRLVSVLISQEVEWVEENLDLDAILEIVSPFFGRIFKIYEKYTNKNRTEMFQKEIKKVTKKLRKKNT